MIVHRIWHWRTRVAHGETRRLRWDGWFLFGIIPVYIRQRSFYDPT